MIKKNSIKFQQKVQITNETISQQSKWPKYHIPKSEIESRINITRSTRHFRHYYLSKPEQAQVFLGPFEDMLYTFGLPKEYLGIILVYLQTRVIRCSRLVSFANKQYQNRSLNLLHSFLVIRTDGTVLNFLVDHRHFSGFHCLHGVY